MLPLEGIRDRRAHHRVGRADGRPGAGLVRRRVVPHREPDAHQHLALEPRQAEPGQLPRPRPRRPALGPRLHLQLAERQQALAGRGPQAPARLLRGPPPRRRLRRADLQLPPRPARSPRARLCARCRASNPGSSSSRCRPMASSGPDSGYAALGPTMEMAAGMSAMIAYPGGKPTVTGPSYMDPIGGFNAAAAILTALHHRDRTGRGQHDRGGAGRGGDAVHRRRSSSPAPTWCPTATTGPTSRRTTPILPPATTAGSRSPPGPTRPGRRSPG